MEILYSARTMAMHEDDGCDFTAKYLHNLTRQPGLPPKTSPVVDMNEERAKVAMSAANFDSNELAGNHVLSALRRYKF